jgi:hypothetical protein
MRPGLALTHLTKSSKVCAGAAGLTFSTSGSTPVRLIWAKSRSGSLGSLRNSATLVACGPLPVSSSV